MRFFPRLVMSALCLCAAPVFGAEPAAVGCQGRVMPQSRILKLAAPADQGVPIVGKLAVEEGDAVEQGGVIAVLVAEAPARFLLEQSVARLAAAKADLAATEASARQTDAEIALQLLDAENARTAAEASLAALKVQSTRRHLSAEAVQEIETQLAAQNAVLEKLRADRPVFEARLEAAVQSAQVQADEASGSRGRIATAGLSEAKAAREAALREYDARIAGAMGERDVLQARLQAGRAAHAQTEREPAEATAAAKQVSLAEARVQAVKNYAAATRQRHAAEINAAQAAVDEAGAAWRLAENRLELTRLRSPIAGRVLRVFSRPGEAVGPNGVVEVADLSRMMVEAEVSVADISRVQPGAGAVVRVPGLEKTFTGKVSRIGLRAGAGALVDDTPTAFKDLRVIPVVIALDDSAALAGYTGTQVQVRIAHE